MATHKCTYRVFFGGVSSVVYEEKHIHNPSVLCLNGYMSAEEPDEKTIKTIASTPQFTVEFGELQDGGAVNCCGMHAKVAFNDKITHLRSLLTGKGVDYEYTEELLYAGAVKRGTEQNYVGRTGTFTVTHVMIADVNYPLAVAESSS